MALSAKTIVLCGGGSLGPVTPLLAIATELRRIEPGVSITWIGTKSGPERRVVEEAGLPFRSIPAGKLRRYFSFANIVDLFRIVAGFVQAFRLLGRLHADVVVSAGGFVAVPVVWAAALRRIPVHVHQQDPIPGLANRLSAPFATSMSVALEKSAGDFQLRGGRHPEWTGNPVRPAVLAGSRAEAVRIYGLEPGVPTVLAIGGGTGAAGLNDLIRGALPRLLIAAQLIHSTGIGKASGVAGAGATARYHEFELITTGLPHALAAADLVVTRAGMGMLSELAALGKPCIIVPMPRSHQETNAALFERSGAAVVLHERDTDAEKFAALVTGLLVDGARREALGTAIRRMNRPDAAARIAQAIVSLRRG